MSDLKPCPFCGGEAELRHNRTWDYEVRCTGCRAKTRLHHENENGAVSDWNSRAERTCECIAEYAKSPIDGKTIVLHRCSSCHELMRPYMNYCPNCGARRVGE